MRPSRCAVLALIAAAALAAAETSEAIARMQGLAEDNGAQLNRLLHDLKTLTRDDNIPCLQA